MTGSRAAKVDFGGLVRQVVQIQPNTNYQLTAMIEGGGRIGVVVAGNGFDSIGNAGQNYRLHTVNFNSGNATTAEIFAQANSEEARFDDFAIVPV